MNLAEQKEYARKLFSLAEILNTLVANSEPRVTGYKELETLIVGTIALLQESKDLLIHGRANESKNFKERVGLAKQIITKDSVDKVEKKKI